MSAVEFLVQELFNNGYFHYGIPDEIVEQAKEMEKQHIIDAWNNGYREFYDGNSTAEEYYNETFKS